MKKLNWLVIKSFFGPFIMSFAVILFILVLQFLALYMNDIFGKGIGLAIIGKLFFYASGRLMLTALPVAILAGALMTFGNMGEYNELAAIKSSGISLFKIGTQMFVLGLAFTGLSLWFSYDVVPASNLKFFSLLYDVGRKKAEISIRPGHFYSDIDGYIIRVSDKNVQTRTLYDVIVYNHTDGRGAVDVITADSARTQNDSKQPNVMKMVLYSGVRHENYKPKPGERSHNYGRTYFDSLYYKFQLKGFDLDRTDEGLFARHQITLPRHQLEEALDSLRLQKAQAVKKFDNYIAPYTRIDSTFLGALPDTTVIKKDSTKETDLLLSKGKIKTQTDSIAKKKPVPVKVERKPTAFDTLLATYQESPPERPADDTSWYVFSLFPDHKPVGLLTKALSNTRSIKNYAEFMVKKTAEQEKRRNRYRYEFHLRDAMPVNCIVFMMIGVSLGAIIRKGGLGIPSLISITLLVLAYVFNAQGKKFAKEGVLDPFVGAWLPIFVFGPIALFLTYKAAVESKLLDENVWSGIGEKVRGLFRKKNRPNPETQ